MEGVELEFRQDALSAIARKALKRKTGARGLRTIVESVLLDTMYDLPSLEHVSKVVVDESVIEHKSDRSEEHTSELQSLMRKSYAVFCVQKKTLEEQNTT